MLSMVNKEANIDLLFRNGLKDFEVLPPVEAWNNILPVIRKKQRPVVVLRAAALIAVLMAISFMAYRWSRELSISDQNQILAVNEESVRAPVNVNKTANTGKIRGKENKTGSKENPNSLKPEQPGIVEFSKDADIEPTTPDMLTEDTYLRNYNNLRIPVILQSVPRFRYNTENLNFSQESLNKPDYTEQKVKIDRWSVTAMASPTYYLRPELSGSDLSDQFNSAEQSRISYSGGVSFAYKISKKLSVQSGLYYSSIGNQVTGISSFAGFRGYDYTKGDHNFEVLTSSGRILTDNSDVFLSDNLGDRVLTRYTKDVFDPAKANLSYINNTLFQNFSYLEMPVVLRYKLVDKTVDFNLIGGLSYNLLVNNTVNTIVDGNRYNIGKTAGLNQFMVSSSMGMGIEYSLSEKFSLNLEPTFRYYLNPFGDIQGLKTHPYSFGVFSGLSYKF
jgi:hypothetical protein